MYKFAAVNFLLLLFSCNDDQFLDIQPPIPAPETTFNTPEGALTALYGIYDVLQSQESVQRFEMIGEYCSPDVNFSGAASGDSPYQSIYQRFILDEFHQDDRGTLPYWEALYTGIYRCNTLLSVLQNENELIGFDSGLREHLIGETYFLRGLFEFKLLVVFAGLPQLQPDFNGKLRGLPFFDHIPAPEEFYPSRPELEESWQRVIDDFQRSYPRLPIRSEFLMAEIGRASRGSAQAMLAKAYLYTENWSESYQHANAVIESGEFWLEGDNEHPGPYRVTRTSAVGSMDIDMPAYRWIFQPEGDNSGGTIFSVQYQADHSQQYPTGHEGNLRPAEFGPYQVLAWNSQAEDYMPTQLAWGLYQPTPFFVETAYQDVGCINEAGEILDPRFRLSVITPYDSVPYYYENDTIRANHPDSVAYFAWSDQSSTGYSSWKYFADPLFRINMTHPGDFPHDNHYFRYADLLLMAAEAAFHLQQPDRALELVNQVRTRARNCGNTGYPKDRTSVTLEDIYAERRVELAFEGHAFFDLVRTRRMAKMFDKAANYLFVVQPGELSEYQVIFPEYFTPGTNEIFPIPKIELANSGGCIIQNPGY